MANIENTDFDWLNGNWASNVEFLTSDSPRAGTAAEPDSQASERVDQTGGEHALPHLRPSGWEVDKQYDKNTVACKTGFTFTAGKSSTAPHIPGTFQIRLTISG